MLLREDILVKPILEEMDSTKLPDGVLCRVKYPVCRIGERNANNRIYEKDVWEKVLANESLVEKLNQRGLFGHAEHPEATQSDLQLTSHVINKMWVDESVMYQEFDVLDTPTGKIVDCLLRAKCMVGCSTRAEGDLEEAENDDGPYSRVLSDSYNYVTTDFTADPSTFGVVPQDIRRNVVSEIKLLLESKEQEEIDFAKSLLSSMKHTVDEMDKKEKDKDERMTLEQMITKDLVKMGALVEYKGKKGKVSAINEGMVDMMVDGKTVSVDGAEMIWVDNAGTITIEPKEDAVLPELPPEGLPDPADIVPDEDIDLQEPVGDEIPEENFEMDMPVESKDGKVKGKITAINEDTVTITAEDGTSISLNTGQVTITLPVPTEEEPVEVEKEVPVDLVPESVDEGKMSVDYVKSGNASIKKAKAALKSGDTEEASKHFADAADDFNDAAKAVKKMKRAADAKEEADKAKDVEVKEEVVEENVDCRHCGAPYEVKNKEDFADSTCPSCGKKQSDEKVDEDGRGPEFRGQGMGRRGRQEESRVFKVGDVVQIEDKEGNTVVVPKATVAQVDEIQDGTLAIEITGSENEDEQQWYNEDDYEIVHLKAVESKVKEAKLNEGQFSWLASDDKQPIYSTEGHQKEVWMIDDKGGVWKESAYEGYGVFGGKDFYELLAEMNGLEGRDAGIDLVFNKEGKEYKSPKLVHGSNTNWEELDEPENHENQGWYAEEEDDDFDESIASTAKEIVDLRIAEAGAKAERDKVLEELGKISDGKVFQTKILVNKLKEAMKRESNLITALRNKLEEKAKEANDLSEKNNSLKANFIKNINKIKDTIVETGKVNAKDSKTLNENHQLTVTEIKKGATLAVKNIRDSFIKQYVKIRVSESGLTLDNNSQALLESRQTLEEVDNTLNEIRDIKRRGALHAEPVEKVVVEKSIRVDEEQEAVNRKVENVLKGFSL